jgi:hypothetical protein
LYVFFGRIELKHQRLQGPLPKQKQIQIQVEEKNGGRFFGRRASQHSFAAKVLVSGGGINDRQSLQDQKKD